MATLDCSWDSKKGLAVLAREKPGTKPLAIVVSGAAGEPFTPYFAGVLPGDALYWAVRVPQSGRFVLGLFPAGDIRETLRALSNLDNSAMRFEFDEGLKVDPMTRVDTVLNLRLCVFSAGGTDFPPRQLFRIKPGTTPRDVIRGIERSGRFKGNAAGLAMTSFSGERQGPSQDPFGGDAAPIRVRFAVRRDSARRLPDLLSLPGFNELYLPVIEVDLTDFRDEAKAVSAGFCFFHRPLSPDGREAAPHVFQANSNAVQMLHERGRTFLICLFDMACHRDVIGVYFAGEKLLTSGNREKTDCLAGMFLGVPSDDGTFGERYRPMPGVAAGFAQLGAQRCAQINMNDINRRRHCAWAETDPVVAGARANLSGGADACAATLAAFIWLLGYLRANPRRREQLVRFGLRTELFQDFVDHPDVVFTLACDEAAHQLRLSRRTSGEVVAPGTVPFLGAASDPSGDPTLPGWLDGLGPRAQFVAWRLLLEGVNLRELKDRDMELDALASEPRRLTVRLNELDDAGRRRVAAETLRELRDDTWSQLARPTGAPALLSVDADLDLVRIAKLSQVEGAAEALQRARAEIEKDLERVAKGVEDAQASLGRELDSSRNREAGAHSAIRRDVAEAEERFFKRYEEGTLPDTDTLRSELHTIAGNIETDGRILLTTINRLYTRVALLALRDTLEAFYALQSKAGPLFHWVQAVLHGGSLTFSPNTRDITPAQLKTARAELKAFRRQLQLHEVRAHFHRPQWTGHRKTDAERHAGAIVAACKNADAWLSRLQPQIQQQDGRDLLKGVIETVEKSADWLAARRVWVDRVQRLLQAIADGEGQDDLKWLRARTTSPPGYWEDVAAGIDEVLALASTGQDPSRVEPQSKPGGLVMPDR